MIQNIKIRNADIADAVVIADFNVRMALETENKQLCPQIVLAGTKYLINNPSLGFYIVAEADKTIIASTMITFEWSDWRNGLFWWVQSVYVLPEYRRKGVFSKIFEHIQSLARKQNNNNICGIRLYVEKDNSTAQKTYTSLGLKKTEYHMFEKLF